IVPLPYSSREKLYKTSPLFAELEPYLESDDFTRWQRIAETESSTIQEAAFIGRYEMQRALRDIMKLPKSPAIFTSTLPPKSMRHVTAEYLNPFKSAVHLILL
ncbi:MAG: hypothetical protein RR009_04580, partial [Oscillospiraceae bacterium]